MDFLTIIILLLYVIGLFFNFTAVIGILRMPDLYCRLHSSSKNTTLGSILIVAGLVMRELQAGQPTAALKVMLIALFLLFVTPIGSHALAAPLINLVRLCGKAASSINILKYLAKGVLTMFEILNTILIIGMLICALLVLQVRSVVHAIIAFSTLGTFLTLIFFQLQAPDVALSEASVGAVAVPIVLLISLAKIRSLLDDPTEVD